MCKMYDMIRERDLVIDEMSIRNNELDNRYLNKVS
jgi:hypothetical protein